jgi:hypothetical protein
LNAPVRAFGIILVVSGLFATYHYLTTRPIEWRPGTLVAADPRQTAPDGAAPIEHGKFRLLPRARFAAEARVLSLSRYHLGTLADVVPLDIAAGWGRMSDSAVLDKLEITQANRFYFWHYDDVPPIPREEIETHSANWHIVPASDSVWDVLQRLRVGDIVDLDGQLVDLEGPDGGTMRTSLRRDDTGAGACEIILVRAAAIRYR